MIPCSVQTHFGAWLVTFRDNASLLLQADYDQAAFACHCGVITAPDDWDGSPSKLDSDWDNIDPTEITECPNEYRSVAQLN